jgi:hypothetical protein
MICVVCWLHYYFALFRPPTGTVQPIPVAARSKAWVCGRSIAGIAGSNYTEGMDICLLWVLCVVR